MSIASHLAMSRHRASAEITARRQRLPVQSTRDVLQIVQMSVAAVVFMENSSHHALLGPILARVPISGTIGAVASGPFKQHGCHARRLSYDSIAGNLSRGVFSSRAGTNEIGTWARSAAMMGKGRLHLAHPSILPRLRLRRGAPIFASRSATRRCCQSTISSSNQPTAFSDSLIGRGNLPACTSA
jgi:hypothetical protein